MDEEGESLVKSLQLKGQGMVHGGRAVGVGLVQIRDDANVEVGDEVQEETQFQWLKLSLVFEPKVDKEFEQVAEVSEFSPAFQCIAAGEVVHLGSGGTDHDRAFRTLSLRPWDRFWVLLDQPLRDGAGVRSGDAGGPQLDLRPV